MVVEVVEVEVEGMVVVVVVVDHPQGKQPRGKASTVRLAGSEAE